MDAYITLVCEAHRERDPKGPLITRVDGAWAYCAGHAEGEHHWREIPPTTRDDLEQGTV